MIQIVRTDANNKDFIELVKALDGELAIRDGEDHAFYAQFNATRFIKYALVAYEKATPIACGAIRESGENTMEIKRMYVKPAGRGRGIASGLLNELETWTRELGCTQCILETGYNQPEAINLYRKNGYQQIPNYGPYAQISNSICFRKMIC